MIRFATSIGSIQPVASRVSQTKVAPVPASVIHFGNQGDRLDLSKTKLVSPAKSSKPSGTLDKLYGTPGKNMGWAVLWGTAGVGTFAIIPPVALGLFVLAGSHVVAAAVQAIQNRKNKPIEQTSQKNKDKWDDDDDLDWSSSSRCNNSRHNHHDSDNHDHDHDSDSWSDFDWND